jgi:hypothetical protein
MHIHGRNVRTDEPGLDGRMALVAVLKMVANMGTWNSSICESSARTCAQPIRKVGVLGEHCREPLHVMPVPPLHEPVYHRHDCLLVGFAFRLRSS